MAASLVTILSGLTMLQTKMPLLLIPSIGITLFLSSCDLFESSQEKPLQSSQEEHFVGGDASIAVTGKNSFSLAIKGINAQQETDFYVGNSLFKKNWVSAPSSTTARDGLGPHFNARSCSACHLTDGRSSTPEVYNAEEALLSPVIRFSIPGETEKGRPVGDPNYGTQLNVASLPNITSEGNVKISWEEIPGRFADGTAYSLRKPTYEFVDLGYGQLDPSISFSPRVGQQLPGLGLLEAIPEQQILDLADESDADGDLISGKPNQIWSKKLQKKVLGRFGWKANEPTLLQIAASAFNKDIGITTSWNFLENCVGDAINCFAQPNGNGGENGELPELENKDLEQVVFYLKALAIPQARNLDDPQVQHGKKVFKEINCSACHNPSFTTGSIADMPQLSNQKIYPYTDLLLHDMGEDLADNRPDHLATGREWRTPPLWALSLVEDVSGHSTLLHDGRARNMTEAIIWHGGEARTARGEFLDLNQSDREALLAFLKAI